MTTTEEQRFAALRKANGVRMEKARLRSQIRAAGRADGAAIAARVVLDSATSMQFHRLLVTVPGVGDQKADRMLGVARINPTFRVDSLLVDKRRRMLLADLLLELS